MNARALLDVERHSDVPSPRREGGMTRVFVHIDRLVVRGRPTDRRAIDAAVAEAIRRELSSRGTVDALVATGSRARVHAGRVRARTGHGAIGAAVGRSLVRGGSA